MEKVRSNKGLNRKKSKGTLKKSEHLENQSAKQNLRKRLSKKGEEDLNVMKAEIVNEAVLHDEGQEGGKKQTVKR